MFEAPDIIYCSVKLQMQHHYNVGTYAEFGDLQEQMSELSCY